MPYQSYSNKTPDVSLEAPIDPKSSEEQYVEAVYEEADNLVTSRDRPLHEEVSFKAVKARLDSEQGITQSQTENQTIDQIEEEVRLKDKERNANISILAAINTKEDADVVTPDSTAMAETTKRKRRVTEILNDTFINAGGETIKAEDVATLEGLQNIIATTLVSPYFKGDTQEHALSIASVMVLGILEQKALMDITKDITGEQTYGTTHARKVLSDYMYSASPDDRLEALKKVGKLYQEDKMYPSEFMQFMLLTALAGEDLGEGNWDYLNYALDALDAIPLLSTVSKTAKAANKGGLIKGVGNLYLDAAKYTFTYKHTKTAEKIVSALTKSQRVAMQKAASTFRKILKDKYKKNENRSGPLHVVTESDPTLGTKLKAQIVTKSSDELDPEDLAKLGITKDEITEELIPLAPGQMYINSTSKARVMLEREVEDLVFKTNPHQVQVFTPQERTNVLNNAINNIAYGVPTTVHNKLAKNTQNVTDLTVHSLRITSKDSGVTYGIKSLDTVGDNGFTIRNKINLNKPLPDTSTGFKMSVLYSNPVTGKGFSKEEALGLKMSLETAYKYRDADIKLLYREAGTGELKPVRVQLDDNGEIAGFASEVTDDVFIRMDYDIYYTHNDLLGEAAGLLRGYTTPINKHIVSGASKITEEFLDITQRSLDISSLSGKTLKEALPKLSDRSLKQRKALDLLLYYGNLTGKEYHIDDIPNVLVPNIDISPKEMAGVIEDYVKIRHVAKKMYDIKDEAIIRYFRESGVKILNADGTKELIKPIKLGDYADVNGQGALNNLTATILSSKRKHKDGANGLIYNVAENKALRLDSAEQLAMLLQEDNYVLAKVFDEGTGHKPPTELPFHKARENPEANSSYSYVLIPRNHPTITIDEIPDKSMLKYRDGWIPSAIRENIFVRLPKRTIVDGAVHEYSDTWGAFKNLREAKETFKEYEKRMMLLKATNPEKVADLIFDGKGRLKVEFDSDKLAPESDIGRIVQDAMQINDLNITPRKKEKLVTYKNRALVMQSPIEAMDFATRTVGQLEGGFHSVVKATQERFLKRYGKDLVNPDEIASEWRDPSSLKAREGEVMRQYLFDLVRFGEKPDEIIQGIIWSLAYAFDVVGVATDLKALNKLAELGYDVSRVFTPLTTTKGLVFKLMIALAPLRHAIMQASQFSFLSAIDLDSARKAATLTLPLIHAANISTSSKVYKASVRMISKTMGVSVKEAVAIIQNFKESGLLQSMDSNMFQIEGINAANKAPAKTLPGQVLRNTSDMLNLIPRVGTAVGFNTGEALNLTATYLFQASRMKKDGVSFLGVGARDRLATLATGTKTLALSPNKNGAYPWQRGWLSAATQFMAFQAKALELLLIDKKAVNLTRNERAKLTAAQFALFGLEGWGLTEAVYAFNAKWQEEFGEPMPTTLDRFLRGGLIDSIFNAIFDFIQGKDGNQENTVAISSSIAPLPDYGSAFLLLMENGFKDPRFFDTILGASKGAGSKINEVIEDFYILIKADDIPVVERVARAAESILRLSTLIDNALRSHLLDKTRGISSGTSGEDTGIVNTQIEKLAYGLFGVSNYRLQEYYRQTIGVDTKHKEIKSLAKSMARYANNKLESSERITSELVRETFNELAPIVGLYDIEEDRKRLTTEFMKALNGSETGQVTAFQRHLSDAVNSSTPRENVLRLLGEFRHMLTPEQRDKVKQILDTLDNGEVPLINPLTVGEDNETRNRNR